MRKKVRDFDLVHVEVVKERTIDQNNEQVGVEDSNREKMEEDEAIGGEGNVEENKIRSNDKMSYKDSNDGSEALYRRRRKTTSVKFDSNTSKPHFETSMNF